MNDLDVGDVHGRWQQIVHVCGREKLSDIVIDHLLEERLTDGLSDAAADLTSTIIGLIICPQSSTAIVLSKRRTPVSMSTSTMTAWPPLENRV